MAIENLKNICENWLEDLRYSNNVLYEEVGSDGGQAVWIRGRVFDPAGADQKTVPMIRDFLLN